MMMMITLTINIYMMIIYTYDLVSLLPFCMLTFLVIIHIIHIIFNRMRQDYLIHPLHVSDTDSMQYSQQFFFVVVCLQLMERPRCL